MKCELIRDESSVIHTTLYCIGIALDIIQYRTTKKALNELVLV